MWMHGCLPLFCRTSRGAGPAAPGGLGPAERDGVRSLDSLGGTAISGGSSDKTELSAGYKVLGHQNAVLESHRSQLSPEAGE